MKRIIQKIISDNSTLKNKVKRALFASEVLLDPRIPEKIRHVAYDHGMFHEALKFNANKNGRELYSLITLQHVARALALMESEPGGIALEIGAGRTGLPILLLLAGFDQVVVNEFSALDEDYDRHFAETLNLLSILTGSSRRSLDEIAVRTGDRVSIRPEFVQWMPFTDAAKIDLPLGSLRAVLSFTVLEHVENIENVIRHTATLLENKGWMCHLVDMRDHDDFEHPLAFLSQSAAGYQHRGAWCNRLRHPDFLALFESAGLTVISSKVTTFNELDSRKSTDFWAMIAVGLDSVFVDRLPDRDIWVTDDLIRSFAPDYQTYSPEDLSVLQAEYIVSKKI